MTDIDIPIDLDSYRGMSADKPAIDPRKHVRDILANQQTLRKSQEDLEGFLLEAPAKTWSDAGLRALYLIQVFASTAEAQDVRRKQLISQTIDSLTLLCTNETELI